MYRTFYDEAKKQWHGLRSRPVLNPEISVGEAVLKATQMYGSKIAQISDDSGVQLTFDDIRERTIRVAVNLQKRGYKPGQMFGIMANNSQNLAPIVFAAFCLGCPYNALYVSFAKEEIKHMLNITRPCLVFCDVETHERMVESLRECDIEAKIITMNGKIDSCEYVEDLFVETGLESTFRPEPVNGTTATAAILCSSGTSGLSKGVCLSHAALLTTQLNFGHVQTYDVLFCSSDLFWISCIMTMLYGALSGATRIITAEPFSPELLFRLIEKHKISFILTTPDYTNAMLNDESIDKYDLTSMRNYCAGGNKPAPGLMTKFNKYFPNGRTHSVIGMTETAGIYASACTTYEDNGTNGQLISNIEAIIVDDNGNRCGPNVDGELCLKPEYPLLGYLNNPEATERAFDGDGFLLTGDIAHFDDKNDLYVVDRRRDIIRYWYQQISPSEIEAVLIRSPDILEACVVGIPDDELVDLPAAAVIRTKRSTITSDEVYALIADTMLDKYRLRGGIYFTDSLPKTPSGKPLRRKVREQLIQLHKEKKFAS